MMLLLLIISFWSQTHFFSFKCIFLAGLPSAQATESFTFLCILVKHAQIILKAQTHTRTQTHTRRQKLSNRRGLCNFRFIYICMSLCIRVYQCYQNTHLIHIFTAELKGAE